ncbi:hypothetical protein J0H58_02300 [bacterium]|nr:hypothetical protein [bacterium]
MRFRTRLGLTALETRDVPDGNPGEILPPPPPPSDPGIYVPYDTSGGPVGDPIGGGETWQAPPPPGSPPPP